MNGDPFAAMSGQQEQITRVLGYMAKRNMYAILDLHSAVGRARSVHDASSLMQRVSRISCRTVLINVRFNLRQRFVIVMALCSYR